MSPGAIRARLVFRVVDGVVEKLCPGSDTCPAHWLPYDCDFFARKGDRLQHRCKACAAEVAQAWRKRNQIPGPNALAVLDAVLYGSWCGPRKKSGA